MKFYLEKEWQEYNSFIKEIREATADLDRQLKEKIEEICKKRCLPYTLWKDECKHTFTPEGFNAKMMGREAIWDDIFDNVTAFIGPEGQWMSSEDCNHPHG